jgi:hypothetical protein
MTLRRRRAAQSMEMTTMPKFYVETDHSDFPDHAIVAENRAEAIQIFVERMSKRWPNCTIVQHGFFLNWDVVSKRGAISDYVQASINQYPNCVRQ